MTKSTLRRVLGAPWREDVEIEHGLVPNHFAPMRHATGDNDETAGTNFELLVSDVEHYPAFDDVGDLLMRMTVWPRFVARHQPMQGDGRGRTGECLLFDALADFLPRNAAPVDLVD